ncbi:MAG: TetR/AcrR family transcriptional regulator [Alphaproteobacteria bacterium]|nr:TetR/AcrR family transcriptional regulator [Alphaproteobacteria bacterium]
MDTGDRKPKGRPATYASDAMRERRHRLLELARAHVAEVGFEAFSMAEVARRADVAKRTIYNAFRSKEHFIAAAIAEYSEERSAGQQLRHPPGSPLWALERFIEPTIRAEAIRDYVAAMMALYHAPGVDRDIWAAIHAAAVARHRPVIEALAAQGALVDGVDADEVIDDLARLKYALVHDWCRGWIGHAESRDRQAAALLMLIRGIVRPEAQAPWTALLARLRRDGLTALLADESAA